MHSASSTSSLLLPPHLSSRVPIARPSASLDSRLKFSHTFAATWTMPGSPSRQVGFASRSASRLTHFLPAGVDGVDVVIGTSSFLREFSHGKDMTYITKTAIEVITFVKSKGIEVRFSSEDSFRSDLVDLLSIYQTVDKIGVNRVGIADTVGCANPRQVYDLVRTLRGVVGCDIETHFHNDTGMAIANAYCALEAGATHIDTCMFLDLLTGVLARCLFLAVLGIGERVGITPLGGLVACLYAANPEYVKAKYNLTMLREVENLVAEAVEVNVPFMNPITGYCAFTHKAGIHAKAILNNPSTYEILKPEDFGLTRYVSIGYALFSCCSCS